MGRRALVVGINEYNHLGPGGQLQGAVSDAERVAALLTHHSNGDPNFSCVVLTSDAAPVTRRKLREALGQLFRGTNDEVLFYFSGHGSVTPTGGYIITQDAESNDDGVSMDELVALANDGKEREATIILDCCGSGTTGNLHVLQDSGGAYQKSLLGQNVSILAASRHNEEAIEIGGHGLFTSLLVDALEGGAADIVGNVTLPAIYAHIEGALGPWDQRPIYKTYITAVSVVRRADPRIEPPMLRRLADLFPAPDYRYQLDPDYEYDEQPTTEKQKIGQLFKRYRDAGLVCAETPGQDFYWVAKYSGRLRLTPLGRYYCRLIKAGRI